MVPLLTLCACQYPGYVPGPAGGDCEITPNDVHQSKGTPGQMGGKTTIECNTTVTDAQLEVQLQEFRDNSWLAIADNSTSAGKYGPRIGTLPAGKIATRQVFAPCQTGTYRLAARGRAQLNGIPSEIPTWEYSSETTDPCDGER